MKSSVYDFFSHEKDKKVLKKYYEISDKAKMSIGVLDNDKAFFTDENLYHIGSISKIFTSLLVLKTIDKYKIDIHTNVNDFLCLKKGDYPTIYECLTHTSKSFLSMSVSLILKNLLLNGFAKKNPYETVRNSDILRRLEMLRFSYNKKKKYRYSDINYAILGILLEKIENKSIVNLLQEFISNDLGLTSTFVGNCDGVVRPIKNGKHIKNWVWNKENPCIAAGGIVSNVSDMLKFAKIIINSDLEYIKNASIISPESKNPKNKNLTTYSFHTFQKSNQLWHVGRMGAYSCMFIVNKKVNSAVITMSNSVGKKKANARYLCKMLYGNLKRKR